VWGGGRTGAIAADTMVGTRRSSPGEEAREVACNRDNEVVQAAMKSAYKKTRGVASKNSTSRATQLKAMRAAKTAKREAEQRISEQQQEVEVMRGHLKGSLKRKSEAFEEKDVSLSFRFSILSVITTASCCRFVQECIRNAIRRHSSRLQIFVIQAGCCRQASFLAHLALILM